MQDKKEELISEVMNMVGDQIDGHTYTSLEIRLREMYDIGFDDGIEYGRENPPGEPEEDKRR